MRRIQSRTYGQTAGQDKKKQWKRAVFTVEAAVIIPLTLFIIAVLIGYCYHVHQSNWCRGAAYEAVLKGTEKGHAGKENRSAADTRMKERIEQIPISVGSIETSVSEGVRLCASWNGTVLEDVFGSRFSFGGKAAVTAFEPVKIKRLEYLMKNIGE